jgi:phosphopantetheinyl transferase
MDLCVLLPGESSKAVIVIVNYSGVIDNDFMKEKNVFSPLEIQQFSRFELKKRRDSYALGRYATKKGILELFPYIDAQSITVDIMSSGVPTLQGLENTEVSISHIPGFGVAAIFDKRGPMGIDFEKLSPEKLDVFKYLATAKDEVVLNELNEVGELSKYGSLWTIKEALSKVLRTGLKIDFEQLEVGSVNIENDVIKYSFKYFPQFEGVSFICGEYVLGIVCHKVDNYNFHELCQPLLKGF